MNRHLYVQIVYIQSKHCYVSYKLSQFDALYYAGNDKRGIDDTHDSTNQSNNAIHIIRFPHESVASPRHDEHVLHQKSL